MKLLARPRPYRYESLSSYIKRVAYDNYCSPSWIRELWEISYFTTTSRANCNITDQTFNAIKNTIDISDQEIRTIDINQFGVGLWESNDENYLQINKKYFIDENNTKFCPKCLEEQNYHKIYWHLKDILVCLEHNLELIDKCVNCGFHLRVENVIDGICQKCGFKLKNSKHIKCNEDLILRNQIHLYTAYGIEYYGNKSKVDSSIDHDMKYYLYLYNFIYNFIVENKNYFYNVSKSKYIVKIKEYSLDLHAAVCTENIINNLPSTFISLLDDMLKAIEYNGYSKYYEYIFNPAILLDNFKINEFVKSNKYNLLCSYAADYFKKQNKLEQFIKRFGDKGIQGKYITTYDVNNLLGIKRREAKKLYKHFTVHEILDHTYFDYYRNYIFIEVEELYQFINQLSNLIEIVDDINSAFLSLRQLIALIDDKSIGCAEVYDFIISNKIKVYSKKYKKYHIDKLYVDIFTRDLIKQHIQLL